CSPSPAHGSDRRPGLRRSATHLLLRPPRGAGPRRPTSSRGAEPREFQRSAQTTPHRSPRYTQNAEVHPLTRINKLPGTATTVGQLLVDDPVGLEVFRHALVGVAEEMGEIMRRAAFSPMIKERNDRSC